MNPNTPFNKNVWQGSESHIEFDNFSSKRLFNPKWYLSGSRPWNIRIAGVKIVSEALQALSIYTSKFSKIGELDIGFNT